MGAIDNLSIEIQKSVDFFERQLKQPPVKKINVLLPFETEAFIARKLTENTHIPVELLNIPEAYPNTRSAASVIGVMLGIQNSKNAVDTSEESTPEKLVEEPQA